MGKKHSLNLKIIAMTSMAVFSLAAVFVSTAAWFTTMRQVKTGGDGFLASKISPVVKRVDIYEKATKSVQKDSEPNPYIYKNTPSLSYIYNSSSVTTAGKENVDIGPYSILEEPKSLLFLFHLDHTRTEELQSCSLSVKTSTTDETSLYYQTPGTDSVKRPLDKVGFKNDLSSIVSFSCFLDTENVLTENGSEFEVNKDGIKRRDLTFVNSMYKYTSSIELTDKDLTGINVIGIILEYRTNLIEHLYSVNLGNPVIDQEYIFFENIDFTFQI